jgi:methanogenic corrinoid protein MtbC1
MKLVLDELADLGLRQGVKVAVGGAPIEEVFSKEIGADYYFESAVRKVKPDILMMAALLTTTIENPH